MQMTSNYMSIRAFRFLSKGNKLMAMLRAYCDASGKSDNPTDSMVTIGGVVSSLDRWESFEDEWAGMLAGFEVLELHMKYLNFLRGEYKGWDEPKRKSFLAKALEIMDKHCEGYMGATMPIEVFRRLTKQQQSVLIDPYYPCFFACIGGLVTSAEHLTPDEQVELVVSNEPGFKGNAQRFWNKCKSDEAPENLRSRLGSIALDGEPKKLLPLQAADLVAYEVNKYLSAEYLYRIQNKPLPRTWPRWTFEQIRKNKKMLIIEVFDRKTVREYFGF